MIETELLLSNKSFPSKAIQAVYGWFRDWVLLGGMDDQERGIYQMVKARLLGVFPEKSWTLKDLELFCRESRERVQGRIGYW